MSRGLGGGLDPFFEQRLRVAALAIVLVFGVFGFRLLQLQVLQGEDHLRRSQRNSIRTMRLVAPRGEIVDREGRVLATTRPAFDLEVIPSELRHAERTFSVLATLLGGEPAGMQERTAQARGPARFQPLQLVADLSWEQLARVESHRFALPGVLTGVRPLRHYPDGPLAAHLLGTVGEIGAGQLEQSRFAGYRPGDLVGQSGVEARLESHLHGRPGGRNVVVDVSGREMELLDEIDPRPGSRAALTLDLDLQRAAAEAFAAVTTDPDEAPLGGAVVALDPRNGEVLVLLSQPSYDPNDFAGSLDPANWRKLVEDPERPLQNRAIAGQYPPGSTYKAFVAAAALAERAVAPEAPVYCPGFFRLGRRTYRCWKREGHGSLALHRALVRSCDVYFYQAGIKLGVDTLARYAAQFGLGRTTGIALSGEQPGLVPTSEWKERRFHEPWMQGETVSTAIGQGFNLVTPLQLAVAYGAIANGGRVLRPRIVLRLEGRDGSAVGELPQVLGQIPFDAGQLARLRHALRGVVQEPGGTGGRSRVPGVEVAGKTGTSQVVRLEHTEHLKEDEIPRRYRDHAWFAAYAPAEEPEIVIAVLVEHGGHGGSAAAPIAQRVLARYFEKHRGGPEGSPPPAEAPADAPAEGTVAAR